MAQSPAKITFHTLNNSDGSVLYASPNGTHLLQAAVHYPLEVPYRSDEVPTDTYIEVSLRPHNGVAMVKERYIERIISKVLKSVILGEETPRCMLQVTIQVMAVETDEELSGGVKSGGQGEGYLDLLVGSVNASFLSCLDGGVQMKGLVGAVLVGVTKGHELKISPALAERKACISLHAFGYNSQNEWILSESSGDFKMEEWEMAEKTARTTVCGPMPGSNRMNGDIDMDGVDSMPCLFDMMRRSVEAKVIQDERWKM